MIDFQKDEDKKISFSFKKGVINKYFICLFRSLVDTRIQEEFKNTSKKSLKSDVIEKVSISDI